jgi:hypothetical protein
LEEPHPLAEDVSLWETWLCTLCESYTWDESGPNSEHIGRFTWHEGQPRVSPIAPLAPGTQSD